MKKLFIILALCPIYVIAEPVNVNDADAETISKALTGIGPKKAEAIVQYRKEHGPFKTLQDLENVAGIGEKTVKLNEKDILISGSPAVAGEAENKKPEKDKSEEAGKKAK